MDFAIACEEFVREIQDYPVGTLDIKRATQLIDDAPLADFFDKMVFHMAVMHRSNHRCCVEGYCYETEAASCADPLTIRSVAASMLLGDLKRMANESDCTIPDSHIAPMTLADIIINWLMTDRISSAGLKKLLADMWADKEGAPLTTERIARLGLEQVSDPKQIEAWIAEVLARNEKVVEQYRAGKTAVIGSLVGQTLKASGNRANPAMVKEMLELNLNTEPCV